MFAARRQIARSFAASSQAACLPLPAALSARRLVPAVARLYTTESASQPADANAPSQKELSDQLAKLHQTLADKESQIKDLHDSYRRSLAEQENIRQRTRKEIENASQFAIQKFAKDMLETVDVLDLALGSVSEQDLQAGGALKTLQEGVKMTQDNFLKALKRHGVERFSPLGEKFDPNHHQAMFQVPVPNKEPGTVLEVTKPGFSLNGRVLRPAQVGVVLDPSN
ncbi:grpE protein-like protein 1 [Polychytrium aggregatum]|uniref:grpE protein-like protein 1 n=1 Tax=Polychytrium aggregatum TaxID=110093 RepID=UPI0022FF0276|nr:grpE protein-like protein 1 [Polychytrium aggregatum]KAI9208497.1 grpE protein-like protein 1 [Polychytrium aggregatum]